MIAPGTPIGPLGLPASYTREQLYGGYGARARCHRRRASGDRQRQIVEWMRGNGPQTVGDIERGIGCSYGLTSTLIAMARAGLIIRHFDRRFEAMS